LVEASRRERRGDWFSGVEFGRPQDVGWGSCIDDLETCAKVGQPEDFANRVEYLPL
jgi:hypothetical protein